MKIIIASIIFGLTLLMILFSINHAAANPATKTNQKYISTNKNKSLYLSEPIKDKSKIQSIQIKSNSTNNIKIIERNYGNKGDLNKDGRIDAKDIDWFRTIIYSQYFFSKNRPDLFWRADIDDNGTLDNKDVTIFINQISQ